MEKIFDINIINNQITTETLLSLANRQILDNWFKKQNLLIKCDILNEHSNEYHKLKSKYQSSTIRISSFYLTVNKFKNKELQIKKKNKSQDLSYLSKTTDFIIKKDKCVRTQIKRDQFLNHISVIKKLKEHKTSLRDIQKILKKNYNIDISHTLIDTLYKEYVDAC